MRPLSKFCSVVAVSGLTLVGLTLSLAQPGRTQTVLTQAVVESMSNQVRVVSQSQSPRSARVSDVIRPGDAIATAASSRADLRFNDQSLARLGAQSIFRFNPGTRNIDLSQGTALVLIRPGQGGTTIRTPNGAAGVRGSALVVRYDPATDTTLVAALTNSGIVVFNQDGSETLPIAAGEMAVFIENQPAKVYKFDLDTFYATSPLVAGLDLNNLEETDSPDGLDEVREETTEALDSQTPIDAEDSETLVNPEFISMTELDDDGEFTDLEISVVDVDINDLDDADLLETLADSRGALDVWSVVVGGETRQQQILMETMMTGGVFPGGGATGGVFPGGGATGGVFPGGGATGGVFPGGGATGGVFPGGGATGGVFPGGGATGGVFPGGGGKP
ncbi:FecR family protein [Spirulina subsalsa]|uniref:FecR family protein n=1 Tax=Spirulina subsalsa TaxID=54311 RepID=UPI00036FED74|nr:FecR family protein [Spirulina subsalsa]